MDTLIYRPAQRQLPAQQPAALSSPKRQPAVGVILIARDAPQETPEDLLAVADEHNLEKKLEACPA